MECTCSIFTVDVLGLSGAEQRIEKGGIKEGYIIGTKINVHLKGGNYDSILYLKAGDIIEGFHKTREYVFFQHDHGIIIVVAYGRLREFTNICLHSKICQKVNRYIP